MLLPACVAPFAGAWIEINKLTEVNSALSVAPFAGAWIEIEKECVRQMQRKSRSLRGSVD